MLLLALSWLSSGLIALAASSSGMPLSQSNQEATEYEVKAVLLFKVASYVAWPKSTFPEKDSPYIIGILGKDPFGKTIDSLLKDQKIRGRPVEIQRFETVEKLKFCHVLFVSSSEKDNMEKIEKACERKSFLLVGDFADFARRGGCIEMYLQKANVRFKINRTVVERTPIKVDPQLFEIGEEVKEG